MGLLKRVIPAKNIVQRLENTILQLVSAKATDKQELIDYLRNGGYTQLQILQAIQKLKTNGKMSEEEPPPEGGVV